MNDDSLYTFLKVCGVEGGFSLKITPQRSGEPFQKTFSHPFAVIGRNPKADLHLKDDKVNLRHAYLQMVAGQLLCVDLYSRSGVYWGDQAQHSGWVEPNQPIRIGSHLIELVEEQSQEANQSLDNSSKLLARSASEENLPHFTLYFGEASKSQTSFRSSWQLDRTLTFVGQANECKVRISDPAVSSYHCSLLCMEEGIWVVDLLSRTGTFLNGKRVRWAPIQDKDEVKIGKFLIRFHEEPPPPVPAEPEQPVVVSNATVQPEPEQPVVASNGIVQTDASPPAVPGDDVPQLPTLVESNTGVPVDVSQMTEDYLQSLSSSPFETQTDFWKGIIAPLFQQFSSMHQHMFDQFQNTLVMIVQMLNSQQQSQFAMVRDELDQLRELNREMSSLQMELLKQKVASSETPSAQSSSPALTNKINKEVPGSLNGEASSASLNGEPSPEEKAKQTPGGEETVPAANSSKTEDDGTEVHSLLTQRLMEIQNERQSLWQKILSKITGN